MKTLCAFLVLLLSAQPLAASPQAELTPLTPGRAVERAITSGETHRYQLRLAPDQLLRVSIEQQGIDLELKGLDAKDKVVLKMDRAQGTRGVEQFYLLGETAAEYRLEIGTVPKMNEAGRYTITVEAWQPPTTEQRQRAVAEQTLQEGEALYSQNAPLEIKQQALAKFEQVLPYFQGAKEQLREAQVLHRIGLYYLTNAERQKAQDYFTRALTIRQAINDRVGLANSFMALGRIYEVSDTRKAIEYFQQSLPLKIELEDRLGELIVRNNMANSYVNLGDIPTGLAYYEQALTITRRMGNQQDEAMLLNNTGQLHVRIGDLQKGLASYQAALPLAEATKDVMGVSYILSNIGQVYDQLEEYPIAEDYYQRAIQLGEQNGDRSLVMGARFNLASILYRQKSYEKAAAVCEQVLKSAQELKHRYLEISSLRQLGKIRAALGEQPAALEYYQKSLSLAQTAGLRSLEATALQEMGRVSEAQTALGYFQQALLIYRAIQNRSAEAIVLIDIAQIEAAQRQYDQAREHGEAAIRIVESQRGTLLSQELRTAFTSGSKGIYDFQTALLMKLHTLHPSQGHAAEAFFLSEQARARSLLDVLHEARAEVRFTGDPALQARERQLQQQLNDKAKQVTQALSNKASAARAAALEKELNTILTDWQTVRAQIRQSSPRYAALTQPQPLRLAEVQQLLDDDTLLLEYALGKERSFLWAVSRTGLKSYELPPRAEIEALARRAYELFTRSSERLVKSQAQTVAAELGRMVLGPVAQQLAGKRLLIVSDGALQYIPFAALPAPVIGGRSLVVGEKTNQPPTTSHQPPLIVNHEIVSLPSASVLPLLREESAARKASKSLAVIADPVFQAGDQRLQAVARKEGTAANLLASNTRSAGNLLTRSATETGTLDFARLPYTRQEAEAIYALTPAQSSFKALDFQASRNVALGAGLAHYRVLHFATHGLLNSQHPELSGLVLSLVDEKGQPQDGFLRLHDIYNLNLNAELVVLSACRTALGKEINGEGLLGLTRGFMYAGAKSVIASVWDVKDEATAELMKRFYQNLLQKKQRPAAALRAAQISVWQEARWAAPYFWAGFTMQGEWR